MKLNLNFKNHTARAAWLGDHFQLKLSLFWVNQMPQYIGHSISSLVCQKGGRIVKSHRNRQRESWGKGRGGCLTNFITVYRLHSLFSLYNVSSLSGTSWIPPWQIKWKFITLLKFIKFCLQLKIQCFVYFQKTFAYRS